MRAVHSQYCASNFAQDALCNCGGNLTSEMAMLRAERHAAISRATSAELDAAHWREEHRRVRADLEQSERERGEVRANLASAEEAALRRAAEVCEEQSRTTRATALGCRDRILALVAETKGAGR